MFHPAAWRRNPNRVDGDTGDNARSLAICHGVRRHRGDSAHDAPQVFLARAAGLRNHRRQELV
jgi:hypothetical protein